MKTTTFNWKAKFTDLRNEHDSDGDSGHEIDLEILAPFVGPNPPEARQEQLQPLNPRHADDLRSPPLQCGPRRRIWRRRGRRRFRVLQGDNPDGSGRRRHGGFAAEVGVAWGCVGYLHAHHRRIWLIKPLLCARGVWSGGPLPVGKIVTSNGLDIFSGFS